MQIFKMVLILLFSVISTGILFTGCIQQNEDKQDSQEQHDNDNNRQTNDDKDDEKDSD
jgi:outer membrane murein-binding lipoprotein Lpp